MLLASVLACGVGAAVVLSDTERASAANVRSLAMTDDFNSSSLNADAWTTYGGADRYLEYTALRMNGINTWGSWIVFQETELSEDWESFTIDMVMAWDGTPSWSGMFFGNTSASGFFYGSPNAYFLQFYSGAQSGEDTAYGNRGLRLGQRDVSTNTGFFGTPDTTEFHSCDVTTDGNLLAGGKPQRVIMEFTRRAAAQGEDVLYDFTFSWGDEDADPESFATITFDDPDYGVNIGGYMGFTTYGETNMEIRSFKLSTGTGSSAQTVFEDDFSEPSISYPSLASGETSWRGVGTNIEERTYCGDFCYVSYDNVANGSLVYTTPIERNAASEKSFELSYDLYLNDLTETTYIGSGFALENAQADPAQSGFIGLRKEGSGYALAHIQGGEVVSESDVTYANSSVTVEMAGYSDGTVEVTIGENRYTFSGLEYDGYLSFSAVTLSGEASAENGYIDNVTLYIYESISPSAEDVGINFQGSSSFTLAGEIIEEHYVNNRKWVMYGGVDLPLQMSRAYVQFHDISGDAAFLSRSQFGDHIARFDFRPSSLPEVEDYSTLAGFGYSFGRTTADASANDAPGVFFRRSGDNGEATVVAVNMTTAGGASQSPCTLNVFEDNQTWYTCMIIISSRTVKVFLKEADAPDSSFELQATYTDVDAYGYAALTIQPSGTAYFYATNYSVTNIDPMTGREV